jgi:hypothetical protein
MHAAWPPPRKGAPTGRYAQETAALILSLDAILHFLFIKISGSLPIQPHGGITLTCCNFISSIKMKYG